ncbi:PEPxxWA-CTERM sorting domain-containing protein [Kordiimonas sp. SCSIO 12610]|uniref:PEPxxWA-CTERM sorting domain-containing protein n=1 Tax=Kordiimonas sp. SCSIO 12610 TaxID=2829597 RepID=UPI00210A7DDA|nr:PEPxxWA-CTERM sorting domain-containing protein [Kordiimonas sp. SCSIO 12610]UTW54368.1 PEP-CTERM sorting domain-containing protein [Kordiimonas sp. SCSIO 12610]
MKLKYYLISVIMAFGLSSNAFAQTTFYSDRMDFEAAVTGLVLNTFDTVVDNGDTIDFGTGTFSTPIATVNDGSGPFDSFYGDGVSISNETVLSDNTFVFEFDSPVHAVGLDIFDLGTRARSTFTVTTSNGDVDLIAENFVGERGNRLFSGLTSVEGITSLTFYNSYFIGDSNFDDVVGFDNLLLARSFSPTVPAVPEPATWLMMIIGFAGIGLSLRRRHNIEFC